jgi:hypothetical protein
MADLGKDDRALRFLPVLNCTMTGPSKKGNEGRAVRPLTVLNGNMNDPSKKSNDGDS